MTSIANSDVDLALGGLVAGLDAIVWEAEALTPSVQPFMAAGAQGNQVQIVIRALLTAQLLVVDLQVLSGTADLTLPAISLHDTLTELFV